MKFIKFSGLLLILALLINVVWTMSSSLCGENGVLQDDSEEEDPAVANLREYLRIDTAHPNPEPGYQMTIQWLEKQGNEIGLEVSVVPLGLQNKVVILTWIGREPSLKTILFDTHMDVVAVEPEKWKYPPFEACKDKKGNIFARGATDMKSYTVALLEAIRRLNERKFQPMRTIHITVLPDEEIGGLEGMKRFVGSEHFINLNVGIGIDECGGNANPNSMRICYAEKASWQFNITTKGETGHGSSLPELTAGHRLQIVINRLLGFRGEQFKMWDHKTDLSFGQITTINLVGLGGGTATNIIAGELWAAFDMRIRQHSNWTFTDVERFIENILEDARLGSNKDDASVQFILKTMETGETKVDDSNVWWTVVHDACKEVNVTCTPVVMDGITDGRYIRNLGIPVFGLSPFLNTFGTAHKHNEFINEFEFLRGIERYTALIRRLSTTP